MKQEIEKNSIAIIDYGIGGLGLYRLLREMNFGPQIIYFSDAGYIPYGKLSAAELKSRLAKIFVCLESLGVNRIIVACNAASTVLPLSGFEHMQIVDFIRFGISAVSKTSSRKILMFAGERTVRAGVYRKQLISAGFLVRQKITQDLSILIEAGDIGSDHLQSRIQHYLSSQANDEALLLACTHYPAISELFKAFMKPNTLIIDPAPEAAAFIGSHWNGAPSACRDVFFSSGNKPRMKTAAKNAFSVEIDEVHTAPF